MFLNITAETAWTMDPQNLACTAQIQDMILEGLGMI